jgi:serine O-acetyltransferase
MLGQRPECGRSALRQLIEEAMAKVSQCIAGTKVGPKSFDRDYSDHYALLLCHLATLLYRRGAVRDASQAFYLNKVLHGVQCSPRAVLPVNFLLWHSGSTVLGSQAAYSEYLVIGPCVSIGQSGEAWPRLGARVFIGPHSAIFGNCDVGEDVTIGAGTVLVNESIPAGQFAYRDRSGSLIVRAPRMAPYINRFFRR